MYNVCMLSINIAKNPFQSFNVTVNGNQRLDFTLKYISSIGYWLVDLSTNDLSINGMKLVLADNIYSQFINKINCGLQIASQYRVDPSLIDDFSSGRYEFNILNQQEAQQAINV